MYESHGQNANAEVFTGSINSITGAHDIATASVTYVKKDTQKSSTMKKIENDKTNERTNAFTLLLFESSQEKKTCYALTHTHTQIANRWAHRGLGPQRRAMPSTTWPGGLSSTRRTTTPLSRITLKSLASYTCSYCDRMGGGGFCS